ncbi:MAG: GGDEF domain-containing protein [Clostridiaceae bacterium]|nr:GGDEF domain-containing protein [Clostridiaceae bacterium]
MSFLNIAQLIDINVVTVIVLLLILWAIISNYHERGMVATQLFIILIILNILLTILDMLGWIWNGMPGKTAWYANFIFNSLLYVCAPLPAAAWYLYAHYQVFHSLRRIKRPAVFLSAVILINLLLTGLSVRTGWYFTIDAANIYHRSPLFFIHVGLVFFILAVTCFMALFNRKLLESRYFYAMLLFILPPVAGSILQVLFYGLFLNWPSMMISVLIVYLQIQDRGLNTDYLTGAYNRRHFEKIINIRIHRPAANQGFAVIIGDLDGFKQINDHYGHDVGDEALLSAVRLIRHCLRHDDLIARFGGDEFYIMLNLSEEVGLQSVVHRINHEFAQFNSSNLQPYSLSISMGAAIYDRSSKMNAEQFLKFVDQLMYQEKSRRQVLPRGGYIHSVSDSIS